MTCAPGSARPGTPCEPRRRPRARDGLRERVASARVGGSRPRGCCGRRRAFREARDLEAQAGGGRRRRVSPCAGPRRAAGASGLAGQTGGDGREGRARALIQGAVSAEDSSRRSYLTPPSRSLESAPLPTHSPLGWRFLRPLPTIRRWDGHPYVPPPFASGVVRAARPALRWSGRSLWSISADGSSRPAPAVCFGFENCGDYSPSPSRLQLPESSVTFTKRSAASPSDPGNG